MCSGSQVNLSRTHTTGSGIPPFLFSVSALCLWNRRRLLDFPIPFIWRPGHTLRGARCISWVLRLRPFLFSCSSFHLLACDWLEWRSWLACDWLECSRLAFCLRCFRSLFQTCSQSWSTLFGLGGLMRDKKSRYHILPLAGSLLSGVSRCRRSSRCSAGMTLRVRRRRVWIKPCSTAWQ